MNRSIRVGRFIMGIRPAILAAFVKRVLRVRRIETATAEGTFWLDPASYIGLTLLEDGIYEPEMLAVLRHFLKPGDTFVDIGANEGYFAVVGARQVGPGGRVLAVEPQERLANVLCRNFALNHCGQISLSQVAVSDRPGEATMHLTPGVNNSASSLIRQTRYPLARQIVACATLEEILSSHGLRECALLKIDIEGWEHEAVLGSRRLFRDGRIGAIALELHPNLLARRGLDGNAITAFLAECGYTPWKGSSNLVLVHGLPG